MWSNVSQEHRYTVFIKVNEHSNQKNLHFDLTSVKIFSADRKETDKEKTNGLTVTW